MRNQRHTLLAGIAALALMAGTGLVLAQDTSQDHKGTSSAQRPNASTQPMQKGETGRTGGNAQQDGKMGQSTAQGGQMDREKKADKGTMKTDETQKGKMGENEPTKGKAGEAQKGKMGENETNKEKMGADKTPNKENMGENATEKGKMDEDRAAQGEPNKAGENRAATDRRPGGAQGSAMGANVKLDEQQRARIRETVIDARGAPKVGRVNFDVRVGTMIPRGRIHAVPVPETLVQIDPSWRGFLYFVFRDDVVIVDPRDMRIVAVLPV